MDSNRIKEIVDRVPWTLFLGGYVAYLAFSFYTFISDPQSPLLQKKAQVTSITAENGRLTEKLKQTQEFLRTLEAKKAELRSLAHDLEELKASLSDQLDVPEFMKMVVTEAAKVGLTVLSIKPDSPKSSEYYTEQPFFLSFRGVYVQLILFLERISNLERILRADMFDMRLQGSSTAQYVEIAGNIQIKAFRYLGTLADKVGKSDQPVSQSPPSNPAAVSPANSPGKKR